MLIQNTSRDALRASLDRLAVQAAKVYAHITATDGVADHEGEAALSLKHSTYSARRRELVKVGLLRDSGTRRPTPSGRDAIVWEAL